MTTYLFALSHYPDPTEPAQTFEAVASWEHCQLAYHPIYHVRTVSGSGEPCPFCPPRGYEAFTDCKIDCEA